MICAAMTNLVRWALVPLSAIAVWFAMVWVGIAGYDMLDRFCPPDLVVSGMCTATWHGPAVEVLILLCTAAVSAGIVIVPALVAPAARSRVAFFAFACGAVYALYVASGGSMWGPFFVSGLSGSAGLWFIVSKGRSSWGE